MSQNHWIESCTINFVLWKVHATEPRITKAASYEKNVFVLFFDRKWPFKHQQFFMWIFTLSNVSQFLVATKRLWKSVCPSVRPSVCPSVRHAFGHAFTFRPSRSNIYRVNGHVYFPLVANPRCYTKIIFRNSRSNEILQNSLAPIVLFPPVKYV